MAKSSHVLKLNLDIEKEVPIHTAIIAGWTGRDKAALEKHIAELEELFDLAMDDGTSSWRLGSDGEWIRRSRDDEDAPLVDLQNELMRSIGERKRGATR